MSNMNAWKFHINQNSKNKVFADLISNRFWKKNHNNIRHQELLKYEKRNSKFLSLSRERYNLQIFFEKLIVQAF